MAALAALCERSPKLVVLKAKFVSETAVRVLRAAAPRLRELHTGVATSSDNLVALLADVAPPLVMPWLSLNVEDLEKEADDESGQARVRGADETAAALRRQPSLRLLELHLSGLDRFENFGEDEENLDDAALFSLWLSKVAPACARLQELRIHDGSVLGPACVAPLASLLLGGALTHLSIQIGWTQHGESLFNDDGDEDASGAARVAATKM